LFGLLAAVLISGEALARCQLKGLVESNALPLENATVVIGRAGTEIARTTTRPDGRFELSYDEFPDLLHSATIKINATRYTEDVRILFREGNGRCLEVSEHYVILERLQIAGNNGSSSTLGLTIYIAPYTLYGNGADAIAQRFNHDMPQIIHHRILAYKSLLRVPTTQMDISVETINESFTAAEGERIRRRGRQLNALGMIAGDGDLIPQNGSEPQIHLTSIFRTIPVYRDQGMIMQPIKDKLPASRASPSRIAEKLHDYWGKQAVLSYVLQRLAIKQGSWGDEELDVLEDLLFAVKDTMTGQDRLLAPLDGLLNMIEQERG
jgi:hypothetical protein